MRKLKRVNEARFTDKKEFYKYFRSILSMLDSLGYSNQYDAFMGDESLSTKCTNINQSVIELLRGESGDVDTLLRGLDEILDGLRKYSSFLNEKISDIEELKAASKELIDSL